MSMSLMTSRRFAPLFWCQFFAAFGDNFLKTALVFVILFETSGANSAALITLAGAALIAPFFFLSGLGGELADRYDKAFVAQRVKLVELGAAIVAVAGFALHSLPVLFVAVLLFGTLASLFGPIKYGILPDLLPRRELPSANALIEGGTFLAILLGTIVAGIAANGNSNPIHFAWLMIFTSLAQLALEPADPEDHRGRARPPHQSEYLRLHRIADQTGPRRSAAVVGRDRGELVLAGRRARAVAVAAAGVVHFRRRRAGGHAVPDHLLGLGGDRLRARGLACGRPHRAVADAGRHGAARLCSRSISAGPRPPSCRRQAR